MISRLSGACYAIQSMVRISNINNIKSIYYSHCHSIIKYGIFLLGNSSNSVKILLNKRKLSELWLVHNLEPYVQVYLNN